MNLIEYREWESVKNWLFITLPLALVSLLFNFYISVFFICIFLLKVCWVGCKLLVINKAFDNAARKSEQVFQDKLDYIFENAKSGIANYLSKEISAIEGQFPTVSIEDTDGVFIVKYKGEESRHKSILAAKEWLESRE